VLPALEDFRFFFTAETLLSGWFRRAFSKRIVEVQMELQQKLIEHLSKEIETHTNNLMLFRSRISFAGLFGPFFLLGSILVATHQVPGATVPSTSKSWLIAGGLLLLSYLTLAWAGASVERHVWRQCNLWRELIADIVSGKVTEVTAKQLRFEENLRLGYLFCFGAMGLAFASAIFMIRYLAK
jgi:hypothetical protein